MGPDLFLTAAWSMTILYHILHFCIIGVHSWLTHSTFSICIIIKFSVPVFISIPAAGRRCETSLMASGRTSDGSAALTPAQRWQGTIDAMRSESTDDAEPSTTNMRASIRSSSRLMRDSSSKLGANLRVRMTGMARRFSPFRCRVITGHGPPLPSRLRLCQDSEV